MVKKCQQNKIINPRTKRCVKKDGAIGRKLQGKATKYMDTPALRKAVAKEKAKGKKAFSIPKRTKLIVGELRDKLVKNGYSRSVVTRMRKADLEKLPPKPAKKVRKRRTKKEMAEAKAMGMEDRDAPKSKPKASRTPVAKKPVAKKGTKAEKALQALLGGTTNFRDRKPVSMGTLQNEMKEIIAMTKNKYGTISLPPNVKTIQDLIGLVIKEYPRVKPKVIAGIVYQTYDATQDNTDNNFRDLSPLKYPGKITKEQEQQLLQTEPDVNITTTRKKRLALAKRMTRVVGEPTTFKNVRYLYDSMDLDSPYGNWEY